MRNIFLLSLFLMFGSGRVLAQEARFGAYLEVLRSQNTVTEYRESFSAKSKNRFGFGLGTCVFFNRGELISFRLSSGLAYIREILRLDYVASNPVLIGWEQSSRGYLTLKIPAHVL